MNPQSLAIEESEQSEEIGIRRTRNSRKAMIISEDDDDLYKSLELASKPT